MKRAHSISLFAALYLVAAAPAQSQDVFSFIQNIAGKYAITWSDLEARRSQLEVEINTAATTSKITAAQAEDFRKELAAITQHINTVKAEGRRLGISQSIDFSNKINILAATLGDAVQNKVASLPDIDALQVQLNNQLDTAITAGQISATTGAGLKAELQQVATMEAAYKADSGTTLTTRQIELLAAKLATAKESIELQIKIGQSAVPALTDRRTAIDNKIQQAFAMGRITAGEAENLKGDLSRVAAQQATFQAGTGVLTGTQVYMLAQSLDQIDDRITTRLSATPTTAVSTAEIDTLRDQIASRINQLRASGKVSSSDANQALAELDKVNSISIAYKTSAGGIRQSQVSRLMSDLADINNRLDQKLALERSNSERPGGYRHGTRHGNWRNERTDTVATNTQPATTTSQPAFNIGSLPVVGVRNFTDIRGYWGEPYITELASRNVIGGFPNGSFAPNDEITRAQFAAIVVRALNLQPAAQGKVFTDVPANHWATGAITAASNAGLIGGFPDGAFKPGDNITRAQALVILSKALHNADSSTKGLQSYTDKAAVPSWAESNVAQAANAKIIVNFPDALQIRPNALATRGEVAGLMYQTLNSLGANLPPVRIGLDSSGM